MIIVLSEFDASLVLIYFRTVFTLMRYNTILGLLLFFGCKTGKISGQTNLPDSFVISIEYKNELEAEKNVLRTLNDASAIENFDVRQVSAYSTEIIANCIRSKYIRINSIQEKLKNTPGVVHVVVNRRNDPNAY